MLEGIECDCLKELSLDHCPLLTDATLTIINENCGSRALASSSSSGHEYDSRSSLYNGSYSSAYSHSYHSSDATIARHTGGLTYLSLVYVNKLTSSGISNLDDLPNLRRLAVDYCPKVSLLELDRLKAHQVDTWLRESRSNKNPKYGSKNRWYTQLNPYQQGKNNHLTEKYISMSINDSPRRLITSRVVCPHMGEDQRVHLMIEAECFDTTED